MTPERVKMLEPEDQVDAEVLSSEINTLVYSTNAYSIPSKLEYIFYKNQAIAGVYYIGDNGHFTEKEKMTRYYALEEELSKLYGKPRHPEELGTNDTQDDMESIRAGGLMYVSEWGVEDKQMGISLVLDQEESKLRLRIMYFTLDEQLRVPYDETYNL